MSGWTGSYPDLHPYIAGEPTAISSLDSIRALQNTLIREDIELDIDPQNVVIWGASEGGYASLMSDRYMPYYAPEFSSVATVAAIPVTDPMALGQHAVVVLGPTTAGIMGSQITHNQWYEADVDLSEIINPQFSSMIEEFLQEECEDFNIFEGVTSVEDVYTESYISGILSGEYEPWTCFLKENSILGTPVPYVRSAPTLIITAEQDDLAIAAPVHHDIDEMCNLGYEIEHLQCAGLGHVDGALDTLGIQWEWIQQRLQGEPLQNPCVVTNPVSCPD